MKASGNFQRFLKLTARSKAERFERTKENVDNRIQYVGQIAREGKLSKKKPKSRIFIRKNKNTE